MTVLEGEGAKNSIRSHTATAPVVEVKDADGKLLVGAEVVFQLPAVGPSGIFNGWLKTQTVRTDDLGRASANGYSPNFEAGRFNLKVTATMGTQTGQVIIAQSNVEGEGGKGGTAAAKSNTWKYVVGLGAAVAVLGAVAATRNGSAAATTPVTPVSITAGGITVAGPR